MQDDIFHKLLVKFVPWFFITPRPPVIALDFPFLPPAAAFWTVQHQCYCLVGSSWVLARLCFFSLQLRCGSEVRLDDDGVRPIKSLDIQAFLVRVC